MSYSGKAYAWDTNTLATFNAVAGVYWIVQAPGTTGQYAVIYVGQTDSFKRRLPEHCNDKADCSWRYAPRYVFAEVIPTEATRLAREKAEVRFYKAAGAAPCNVQVA